MLFERDAIDVMDSAGALIAQIGGMGEGPGEFQLIARTGRIDSTTLWIADSRLSRLTMLDLGTLSLSQKRYRDELSQVGEFLVNWSTPVGINADGQSLRVGIIAKSTAERSSSDAPQVVVGWHPPDSAHPAVLAVQHSSPECVIVESGRRHDVPECPREFHAVSPNGGKVAVAIPVRQGPPDTYSFVMLNSDGDTSYVVSHRLTGMELPATGPYPDDSPFAKYDRLPQFIPRPDRLAVVNYLSVGDDGSLWVRGIVRDGHRVWHVLDSVGQKVGVLWISEEYWVDDVGTNQALATIDQEDGSIAIYRIRIE